MAFRSQDLPKTIRRDKRTGTRRLYPRFLRDDAIKPQLAIAIRFFETKLGLLRRELEADPLIQLFGEPRLARCLVSCLGRSYRYRTRQFSDLLGTERAAALAEQGIVTPRDLRALAYANAQDAGGFVAPAERAEYLNTLLADLDLVEVEQALWLDAPDQALLIRVGPVPTVEDTIALYQLQLLESFLRLAPTVTLGLRGDRALIAALAARHEVRVTLGATTVTLHGQQDALGSWSRHGQRLARLVVLLAGLNLVGPGQATVAIGDEICDWPLDAATLQYAQPKQSWASSADTWAATAEFLAAAQRRQGRLAGWRLQRWPEPQVTVDGVIWPDCTINRGTITIGLLALTAAQVRTKATALLALAERLPFIVLVRGPLRAVPLGLTVFSLDSPDLVADLDAYLTRTFPLDTGKLAPAWLTALAEATRAAGTLAESELARRLDCSEELVAARLNVLEEPDLQYIDGFGLCAEPFLADAQELYDGEVARGSGRLDLGILGRRLRTFVGHNEGLYALIAHLSGELRAVA